ncbi:MAG: hypothetical protein ACYTBJ_01650 [Planctomycetota bacterium]|jgi:hypothetical protein
MPAGVRRRGGQWEIYDKDTGAHKGWSDSKAKAEASARIRNRAWREKQGGQ